jgi:hypothetical protein
VQTPDGQAAVTSTQGALRGPDDGSPVSVHIIPQRTYPNPGNIQLSTNVYCITAGTPMVPGREALVTLSYSDGVPAPSDIFSYQPGSHPSWQKLGTTGTAAPYSISVRIMSLGCFGGGTVKSSGGAGQTSSSGLGGQTLPILVAVLIVLLLLAALPIVVLRRRTSAPEEDDDEAPRPHS